MWLGYVYLLDLRLNCQYRVGLDTAVDSKRDGPNLAAVDWIGLQSSPRRSLLEGAGLGGDCFSSIECFRPCCNFIFRSKMDNRELRTRCG